MPVLKVSPEEHQAIAARIRELIGPRNQDLSETAVRLGVAESALRASIDLHEPRATIGVLLAIIREYAVDQTWLLSGEYDLSTHRRAIAENGSLTRDDLRELTFERITPAGIRIADLIPEDDARSR